MWLAESCLAEEPGVEGIIKSQTGKGRGRDPGGERACVKVRNWLNEEFTDAGAEREAMCINEAQRT